MQPRASFLPPPPYPCAGTQQQQPTQQQSQFLPQMSLNPYQQLFYNSDVLMQQQQQQQSQQPSQPQPQQQQPYISMCLQQPQSQIIQPQQLLLQPQIPQQSMESQQQLPFLYTPALHDQHQQEQQTLESLTAQVAALLYSNFGNLPAQQQLQFFPSETTQQHLLQNTKMNAFNNSSNGNNALGFIDQQQHEILQNNVIPLGLDSQQLMSLSSASFLDQLAQLTQVPNDQNVSLATALAAAQIIQTSPNYNFSSLGEIATAPSTSQGTAATPELIFTTLNQNQKSEQKQQNSDTQLNTKPFNRSTLEKHHAFSPVEASHNARTSSPHSSASRISNSQIHTHQPFDTQTCPREQKTLPIVFLQHPQSDENTDKKIKFQETDRMLEEEGAEDQKMMNSKSRNTPAAGQTNKLIKKKKKSSCSAKTRQIPQQSSDSFTNSSSLTISLKKNENSLNVPAINDLKTQFTPTIQNRSCADAQDIVLPLSKDTKLFNDLLDPLLLFLRENENKEQKSTPVEQVQKKSSKKTSLSHKKKEIQQQKSKKRQDNMIQEQSEIESKIQEKQTDVMLKEICQKIKVETLNEKPQNMEQEEEQEHGQQQLDEENHEAHPQQQEQLTELVNPQLSVPSSPESVPLKILRISPRRRVCSSEMPEESDNEDHHHHLLRSTSKHSSEETRDQKHQTQLVTPVKKIQRLKRISQITEEHNRKTNKLSTKNSQTGLPHRNQTFSDKKQAQKPAIQESPTVLFKTRNQSKVLNEITKNTRNQSDDNDSNAFSNIDSFSEATQSLMNQFEKHYLKYVIHSNLEERINEFKTFMKNARKNDEQIGLLLNPRACPFSQSFIDFLRLPAIKWIKKNVDPKKQTIYFQLIQMFKSEDRGISGLRPRRERNPLSNFAPLK